MTVGELIKELQQVDSSLPAVIINGPDFDVVTKVEIACGVDVCNDIDPHWWYAEGALGDKNAYPLLWIIG